MGLYSYSNNLHHADYTEYLRGKDGYDRWDGLYTAPKTFDRDHIGAIKAVKGKKSRLSLIDLNLIQEGDVYSTFHSVIEQQSTYGNIFVLKNPEDQQKGHSERLCCMCYYLLLTYIKYQTKYGYSLLYLSRMIRETLFDRKSLVDILTLHPEHRKDMKPEMLQGSLF